MGDFTNNGTKIGTCGKAYYATYWQIVKNFQTHGNNGDVIYYYNLKRENGFSYAFPFPEFDGKKLGDISQFHIQQKNGKVLYPVYLLDSECKDIQHNETRSEIRDIYTDEKKNFYVKCFQDPLNYRSNKAPDQNKFYMEYTGFINGKPSILIYCAYCGAGTHFTLDDDNENEITKAIKRQIKELETELNKAEIRLENTGTFNSRRPLELIKSEIDYHKEILNRVYEWYNMPTMEDHKENLIQARTLNNLYANKYC